MALCRSPAWYAYHTAEDFFHYYNMDKKMNEGRTFRHAVDRLTMYYEKHPTESITSLDQMTIENHPGGLSIERGGCSISKEDATDKEDYWMVIKTP